MTRSRLVGAILGVVTALGALAAPAGAAVTWRATSQAQNASGATTLVLSTPSGVRAGDVMFNSVQAVGSGTATPPAGWTMLSSGPTTYGYGATYYRVATATEDATHTWNLGTVRKAAGAIAAYVGLDTSDPIMAFAIGSSSASTTTSAPSVTTTAANVRVLVGFGGGAASTFTTTVPAGTNDRGLSAVRTSGAGNVIASHAADFNQAAAGATSVRNFTTSIAVDGGATQTAMRSGVLRFGAAPDVPDLPAVALNGRAQTTSTAMDAISVKDESNAGAGWNVTVQGDDGAGKKPVFTPYCTIGAGCGADPPGYVAGGVSLPAGSLKLTTTGGTVTSGSGTAPAYRCGADCLIDAASPTSLAGAAVGAGRGPWSLNFAAGSLTLSTPSTLRTLPAGEVYRADVIWTLSSGP